MGLNVELNVGGIFECPKGHAAKIVWISADKKTMAVACPQEHLRGTENVNMGHAYYKNQLKEKKEVYVKNTVFIMETGSHIAEAVGSQNGYKL